MKMPGVVWPSQLDMSASLDNFREFFALFGFEEWPVDAIEHNKGVEKIALYVSRGEVQHVARQHPDTGLWQSKMGPEEDIEHRHPNDVVGNQCGQVAALMGRGYQLPDPQMAGISDLWRPG